MFNDKYPIKTQPHMIQSPSRHYLPQRAANLGVPLPNTPPPVASPFELHFPKYLPPVNKSLRFSCHLVNPLTIPPIDAHSLLFSEGIMQPTLALSSPPATLDYFTPRARSTLPILLGATSLSLTAGTYALYEFWLNLWPPLTPDAQNLSPLSLSCYATLLLGPLFAIILGFLALHATPAQQKLALLMGKSGIALSALLLTFLIVVLLSV